MSETNENPTEDNSSIINEQTNSTEINDQENSLNSVDLINDESINQQRISLESNENEHFEKTISSVEDQQTKESINFNENETNHFSIDIHQETNSFEENSQLNDNHLTTSLSDENHSIPTDENQNGFEMIDHDENSSDQLNHQQEIEEKNENQTLVESFNQENQENQIKLNENLIETKEIHQSTSIASNEIQIDDHSFENLLSDGSLRKKILIHGKNDSKPKRSYFVEISYRIILFDQELNKEILLKNIENEYDFLCENDLIEAMDLTIQTMNENEKSFIQSDLSHSYGISMDVDQLISSMIKTNPHQYQIQIDLELHRSISPFNIQEFTIEQRLYWGDRKRQRGNLYFNRQDYSKSIQCYYGALRFIDLNVNPTSFSLTDEDQTKFLEYFIEIQNNLVQVFFQINDYDQCLSTIDSILQRDQYNSQALFYQGQTLIQLKKYQDASQVLKNSLKNQTNSSTIDEIKQLIVQCQNHLEKEKNEEKQLYQRMFSNLNNSTNKEKIHLDQSREQNQTINSTKHFSWLPCFGLAATIVGLSILFYFHKNKNMR